MLSTFIFSLLALSSGISAQIEIPPIPNCGLPADPRCLITSSQYTIVGTVRSTNIGASGSNATATNYNATIAIRCAWASFSSPISDGAGLAGNSFTVVNFGFPKPGCPANTGASATVNDTAIFFIYVARPAGRNGVTSHIFSITSICAGSIPYNADNARLVAEVLRTNPDNAIKAANIGEATCALPSLTTPSGNGTTTQPGGSNPAPSASLTIPNSGGFSLVNGPSSFLWSVAAGVIAAVLASLA